MASGPLAGVRILDLTHVWAGPLATRILADLGADVLKVEAPMGRGPKVFPGVPLGGFVGGAASAEPWNVNAVFVKLMRNKQSLAIDLKTEDGRTIFLKLVSISDVVIENFSARAMANLGLDYPNLREANTKIIHVAMPGYGLNGPYSGRVAFGPTVEPMSGLTAAMGYGPDEPRATAMAMPDPSSAVSATAAVLTALRLRESTGEGRLVEMSLHESAVSYAGPWLVDTQFGIEPERIGNRHPQMAPHGMYACLGEDNWLAIGCRNDRDYQALCEVGKLDVDSSWPLSERMAQRERLDEAISNWTRTQPHETVTAQLIDAQVPVGKVLDTAGMLANPQSIHRDFFVPLEQGTPMPGNPIKMSSISNSDWTPCPKLGEDNWPVLHDWLGYDEPTVNELFEKGIIVDEPPR
ncbi:MAG: CoA transferase [Gammaproteobacteria bacterium]|nr:CoA transferase [Gammaproteobacteria bacterium]